MCSACDGCAEAPPSGPIASQRLLLGRLLVGLQEGVERLLGFGLAYALLIDDLGLGFAADALDRRVRLGALEVLQELERVRVADVAERVDRRAARGVVEIAAEELLDRFGGARIADLAERGEDALLHLLIGRAQKELLNE